jgi:hypothetical protein
MDKTISNIKSLALSVLNYDEYVTFMSYIYNGEYNLARLFLKSYYHHDDAENHNRLEDILIDLIMKKEDEGGDESEQANRDSG